MKPSPRRLGALASAAVALSLAPTCASGGSAATAATTTSNAAASAASATAGRAATPRSAAVAPLASSVAADEQAFALDLLKRLGGATAATANLVLSPSSLDTLLAMVEPGAAGTTQAGIAEALHSQRLPAATQAAGWRLLEAALAAMAKQDHISLDAANEAWLQNNLPVREGYLQMLEGDFGAGLEHGNLDGDPAAAAAAINAWVASRTRGHITHLLDASQLEDAVAVLVDAVYMDAPWEKSFPSSLTQPAPFHLSPDSTVNVPMMSSGPGRLLGVIDTASIEAAALPYAGGRLTALVLMPPLGQLASFEAGLTPTRLASLVGDLQQQPALVELPKFEAQSSLELNSVLSAMGMGQAFTRTANFTNLSPVPLQLSFVVQDAQIEVSEKGTEASAASGAGIAPTAIAVPVGPRLIFDHPFLMLVRDDVTGAIVFEAQVGDPAGSPEG